MSYNTTVTTPSYSKTIIAPDLFVDQKQLKPAVTIEAITFEGTAPEDIKYLLLLKMYNDDDDINLDVVEQWGIIVGRQNCYDYLKNLTINDTLDIDESFVMGEDFKISDAITVYQFFDHMLKSGKIQDDESFNPEEYRTYPGQEPIKITNLTFVDSSYVTED